MIIKGKLYDGLHAGSRDIRVRLGEDGYLTAEPDGFAPVSIQQVTVSTRIGNTPRHLTLPSGTMVETTDHERLDAWLASLGIKTSWLHRLESNMRFAAGAVVVVASIFTGSAIWGIPWLSTRAAYALPPEVNSYIGRGTLETLDKRVFKATTLEASRHQQLADQFGNLVPHDSAGIRYRLEFRGGGFIGANAFALPDGTVVVTDELVKLAQNDEEILSILLHEIGHVVYRHSLRQVISHSTLIALTTVITGDVNSAGSLVLAMPNILIDSSYSREFETEADTYALEHMAEFGIPASRFADFMERLERCGMLLAKADETEDGESEPVDAPGCEAVEHDAEGKEPAYYSWTNYISTHPPSADRIARFRQARQ